MNTALVLLSCLVLAACASAGSKLDGAWQSNRDLTLAELRKLPELSEEQLAALSRPDLFGRLIQIYDGDRWVIVLEGQCAFSSLERLSATRDSVTVRYRDQISGQEHDVTLAVRDDRLVIPIQQLPGAGEVFTRVSLSEVRKRFPCVEAALK